MLARFGALVLLTAWLPMVLSEAPLSLPIVCVGIGAALFAIPGVPGFLPHPSEQLATVERMTELVVIIALMGAGLKLDRVIGWRSWVIDLAAARALPCRLPLQHSPFWVIGCSVSAWRPRCSLRPLLPPRIQCWRATSKSARRNREKRTKPGLLSLPRPELNDGLAFPFVMCAIAIGEASRTGEPWFLELVRQRGDVAAFGRDGHRRGGRLRNRLARLPCAEPGKAVAHGRWLRGARGHLPRAYGLSEMAHGYVSWPCSWQRSRSARPSEATATMRSCTTSPNRLSAC